MNEAGVKARKVNKISQESPTVMDLILGHKIDLVIDTPTQGRDKSRDGFLIRRTAIETGVNCLTSLDRQSPCHQPRKRRRKTLPRGYRLLVKRNNFLINS